jgi:predicted  nucleic acid-binding Zn-ribbon protein
MLIGQGKPERTVPYLSPMLAGIANAKLDEEVFAEQQQSLLRELAKYDVGSDGAVAVLQNFGGMFHVATKNAATTRMGSQQLRVEVGQGTQTLSEIKEELRSINSLLFTSLSWSQSRELQERIAKLSEKLKQLEDELTKQSETKPGLLSIVPVIGDFASAMSQVLSGVSSGDFSAAAEGMRKASVAYNALVTPKNLQTLQQAIDQTKKDLADATSEYEQLITYVADQKQRYFSERFVDLQQALQRRGSVASKLTSESFLFPDLLKVALISYFDDVAGDKTQLRTNLKALQVYLRDFPNQEPYIKLSEINWSCDSTNCQTYQASSDWREVQARFRLGSKIELVSLYILAPIPRTTPPLPTFLLDPSQISIKRLEHSPTRTIQMFVAPTLN